MSTRIISTASAKGGVGASFVANNLAVGLGLLSKTPTLLLDLDLILGGSQASLLSLEKEAATQSLEILLELPEISEPDLKAAVIPHPKLGVHILAAPPGNKIQRLSPQRLYEILLIASKHYKNIVIDSAQPYFNEILGVCLDCSSLVLQVVIPDIVSLQATSHFLQKVETYDFSLNKFRLVVNMANLSSDLTAQDIGEYFEALLKRSLEYEIPFEPLAVIKAINRGVPILQKGKTENIINALLNLSKGMIQAPVVKIAEINISSHSEVLAANEVLSYRENISSSALEGQTSFQPTTPSKALTTIPQAIAGWTPEQYRNVKQKLHQRLLEEIKLHHMELDNPERRKQVRQELRDKVSEIMLTDKIEISSRKDRMVLIEEILDEALGLGPLEQLLNDQTVSEIMVNGPNQIFIERNGRLELSHRAFVNETQLRVVIDRIMSPLGRRVDESHPMEDARLPDGARVNIIIPPLALDGATITIRKFPHDRITVEKIIRYDTITPDMAEFLDGAVKARLNILICGGTGSGKTTLLNILSSFIPHGLRIVTIEDAAELQLDQKHVIRLEARPANVEGKGYVSIRDLVRNSLRMRPDRIVVGEVRGGEALDMLQAMNTGHEGSLTTCHANSPRDALSRLETMVLMAGVDLPIKAIRDQIASAVDLIVHQSRMRDGTRKVTHIAEVVGMDGDIITTQDIFKYEQLTVDAQGRVIGKFKQAEIRPTVLERFLSSGIKIPRCFDMSQLATEMPVLAEDDETEETKPQKKGFFW